MHTMWYARKSQNLVSRENQGLQVHFSDASPPKACLDMSHPDQTDLLITYGSSQPLNLRLVTQCYTGLLLQYSLTHPYNLLHVGFFDSLLPFA